MEFADSSLKSRPLPKDRLVLHLTQDYSLKSGFTQRSVELLQVSLGGSQFLALLLTCVVEDFVFGLGPAEILRPLLQLIQPLLLIGVSFSERRNGFSVRKIRRLILDLLDDGLPQPFNLLP